MLKNVLQLHVRLMFSVGLRWASHLELEQLGDEHGLRQCRCWRQRFTHRDATSPLDVRRSNSRYPTPEKYAAIKFYSVSRPYNVNTDPRGRLRFCWF